MPLSARDRPDVLERLSREHFDLVVIGAGINGAAAARAAALRGYSVALIEQDDIAFGTSSRSSRLIHGGLRYLEHMQFGLVFESLAERALLSRLARHIVRPLEFVMPVYRGDRVGLNTVRMGLLLYDVMALFRSYRGHRKLSVEQISGRVPGIREGGLRGALSYFDYRTDDGRLVLENVISAVEQGAVALSYARVAGVERGRVRVRDRLGGEEVTVRGRAIRAAGPWTDLVLGNARPHQRWLRPTKGVHIVVPHGRMPLECAVVMQHPADGRVVFVLPFHEHTAVGTTDTDFEGDPGAVTATEQDVDYLLQAIAYYFPSVHLGPDDVFSTWAGVRPLVREETDDPSAVSREERVETLEDGVVVVAGGKLTTYRRIAATCVDAAADLIAERGGPQRRREVPQEKSPLPGADGLESDEDLKQLAARLGQALDDPQVGSYLAHAHGVRADRVLELVQQRPELGRRIVADLPIPGPRWSSPPGRS